MSETGSVPPPPPPVPLSTEDAVLQTFVPYKNPYGLIAYYCGVFAIIPCFGVLLGSAALVLGIMGVRYANAHPECRGKGHAITGIVLGTVFLLLNILGVLLVFGVSSFAQY
ncbi:MAG: hypothetical protein KJ052_04430 [Candidatus Hydrogenedentes bacterium]|nr:hypothetical protein [Candidatus Hydrogenedentota bacterium]